MTDHRKRLGLDIERVWIVDQAVGPALVFRGPRPDQNAFPNAVQYMRVMSRDEVEKLAYSEDGCDTQQLMNSYLRTIEGQRREINRLGAKMAAPQAQPCRCSTYCAHKSYPDAPLSRGYFCREKVAARCSHPESKQSAVTAWKCECGALVSEVTNRSPT